MMKKILLVFFGLLVLGGCSTETWRRKSSPPEPHLSQNLTPEQRIYKLLADLEKKPVPQLSSYSICADNFDYSTNRVEYVCRVCDSTTILRPTKDNTDEGDAYYWDFEWTIPGRRKLIEEIQSLGLDAALDERSLCDACRPKINPPPKFGDFYLVVWFDGKTTRTLLRYFEDFAILKPFLEGKLVWLGWYYDERPLKPEIPRIRQLLGLE